MRHNISDERGPDQEIILVEVPAWPVVVEMKAELAGVAAPQGVLPEQVRYDHRLVARVARIQFTVGVLLQHVEVGRVKLIAIVQCIAEEPCTQIDIVKDEAAKIADERLNAGTNRSRVEVRALAALAVASAQKRNSRGVVAEPNLGERVLQGDVSVQSVGPASRIDVDDAILLSVEVIDVEVRRYVNSPVDRLEGGVPVKELERHREVLSEEGLCSSAE